VVGVVEIVATSPLTWHLAAINGWNRLAAGVRTRVGDYVSPFRANASAPA
jgi:hypothetical protein